LYNVFSFHRENATNLKGQIDSVERSESIARFRLVAFQDMNIVSELSLEILLAGVRESEFDERVPAGDFLFHVPY
jgi:hypothetical protein